MTLNQIDGGTARRIGETIRTQRLGLGITKAEAARQAGVSRRTWHEVEAGTRTTPTADTLARFDLALGYEVGTLFAMTGRTDDEQIEMLRNEVIELVRRMSGDELKAMLEPKGAQELLLSRLDSLDGELRRLRQLNELQHEAVAPVQSIDSRRVG